ncbi:MAG: ferrochelatase [Nitrospirae bacterium]|nr:ferrochelatase [Nitrospirota bacterium]
MEGKVNNIKKETIGVMLLNLGGPDSLQAIKPFLYNLFSDRQIIRLGPSFMQKPLAWLISSIRSKKTEKMYRMIGGKSPILDITMAQAKALEETLNKKSSNNQLSTIKTQISFKVYVGMRYWHPLIEDIISEIHRDGIRKIIALSLYPQYSIATSGSSLSKFDEATKFFNMDTMTIPYWNKHPLYIEALIDMIKKGIESFSPSFPPKGRGIDEEDIHVLFSAHSLPKKIIEQGDPYEQQTKETIQEITKLIPLKWHLSYQSKSGPVEWLGPSTKEKLQELAQKKIKNILVVPISFVSDHIETLFEIDILYRNLAEKLGMNFRRIDSLNTYPKFIDALAGIIIKKLIDSG